MLTNTLRIIILVCAIFSFKNVVSKTQFKFNENSAFGFVENKGQMSDCNGKPVNQVLYKAETPNLNIWITTKGITYQFIEWYKEKNLDKSDPRKNIKKMGWRRVDVDLEGVSIKKEQCTPEGEINQGSENYYLTSCPNGVFNVRTFKKITIKNIYKGIDWILYTQDGFLKQDFLVHPNANPSQIKMLYKGHGEIKIEKNQIEFKNDLGNIKEGKLYCYQNSKEVKSEYKAKKVDNRQNSIDNQPTTNNQLQFSYEVSIQLERYNKNQALVIDPQLVWSTFYGGNAADGAMSIESDVNGDIFIASYIHSTNYPTQNPGAGAYYQPAMGGPLSVANVSILRFSNTGQRLWATYYGGDGHDVGSSICIDNTGNIYVTGYAQSSNFPTQNLPGAYNQAANAGHYDLFVLRFNPAGLRQWATLYGGVNTDYAHSICADNTGNIFITGTTNSAGFPLNALAGAYNQAAIGGNFDAFILEFSNTGAVVWSTYYGGNDDDEAYAITKDVNGNTFIAGYTKSANLPTQISGASYTQAFGGTRDAFIVQLSNAGVLNWGTFYGGSSDDIGFSIACDNNSDVYVLGQTNSANIPLQNLPGAYNQSVLSGDDALLLKFSNTGTRLWATLYGGTGTEFPSSYDNIAIDNCNNVYFSFTTTSTDVPVKNYSQCSSQFFDPTLTGKSDCFFTKFNSSCNLLWATYWGGDGGDFRESMTIDNNNNLFIIGEWAENNITPSTYPTLNPGGSAFYSNTHMGSDDTYIAKFSPPKITFTQSQVNNTLCNPCNGSATISISCGSANYNYVWSNNTQTLNDTNNTNTITGLCVGAYTVTTTANCNQTATAIFSITGTPSSVTSTVNANICTGSNYTLPGGNLVNTSGIYIDTSLSANGCDSIITTNLTVSNSINITQNPIICTGNSYILPDGTPVNLTGTYIDTLTAIGGCDSIITINLAVTPVLTYTQNPIICTGNTFLLPGGTSVASGGIYFDTLNTSSGCDSIITTNLTVTAVLTFIQNPVICSDSTFVLPSGNSVNISGTYTDTLQTISGCDSVVTTNLIVNQTAQISQTGNICDGESFLLPGGTYVNISGIYDDTLFTSKGCDSIITTNVTVNPLPIITISPDVTIIKGDSTILTATGGGSYSWSPSYGLNTISGANVIAYPNQTTTYCVIVTNSYGCIDSACVKVSVELPCPVSENLDVPNAFSPNGDNVNDEFCLQGWTPCIEKFQIIIYNRWGEKVYESNQPDFCWNARLPDGQGMHRGTIMEPQVFVYYIKAKYTGIDKTINKTGNISLIK